MKALLTAGGRATRLRPITHTSNKHLIPIANKPMIDYGLEAIAEAGIKEVYINISPETGADVRDHVGDGSRFDLNVEYIVQKKPGGLSQVVLLAEKKIGSEPFVYYLGDNVIAGGIKHFVEEFERQKSDVHLVLAKVKDPERFGVPEIKNNQIVGVEEKPQNPKSNFAVTGIYIYNSKIFNAVKAIKPSARGELEISDAHDWLINKGAKVTYSENTGWWKDTGKPEDLLEANRLVLDKMVRESNPVIDEDSTISGKVVVGENVNIERSYIRGPVIIGDNVLIKNSYIGPYTSIDDGCTVEESEVEFSIMLKGSQISGVPVRIENSLLGKDTEIRGAKCPKVYSFFVGDQSKIYVP